MTNVIEIIGLRKTYGDFGLRDICFSVPDNCITGFIGVNGAGKSTTIKCILNLIKAESGSVKFWGLDIKSHEQEIKNRIGVVLDEGAFYEDLTMSEMKRIIAPAYTSWDEATYKSIMEQFSLNPKQKISTLSKGMKAKYALVLALSHHAELLIMDEPTSGLDPLIRSEFMKMLLDFMKQDGKSVFFSTHITSDLDRVADMLILIHDGNIVFQEEKDQLLEKHRIAKGSCTLLTPQIREQFLSLDETGYGFSGISKDAMKLKSVCPDILLEKAQIEDVMLSYIGGEKHE
ncbi:MAG: ABC transporter ATP-binding protein [Clostridiaceae bacterium]|nr:ABC transporter ATP-binding protein [Clostridiaceae bacterium]